MNGIRLTQNIAGNNHVWEIEYLANTTTTLTVSETLDAIAGDKDVYIPIPREQCPPIVQDVEGGALWFQRKTSKPKDKHTYVVLEEGL